MSATPRPSPKLTATPGDVMIRSALGVDPLGVALLGGSVRHPYVRPTATPRP